MKQLIRDVMELLKSDGRLTYIQNGGGIFAISRLDEFPHQVKTPSVVLIDQGTADVRHLSSHVVWLGFRLRLYCVQRLFDRKEAISGSPFVKNVEDVATDVRHVLDMNRMNGKYAKAFFITGDETAPLDRNNMHLQQKGLTFEYVRIES
jgi:hypothetical protein